MVLSVVVTPKMVAYDIQEMRQKLAGEDGAVDGTGFLEREIVD